MLRAIHELQTGVVESNFRRVKRLLDQLAELKPDNCPPPRWEVFIDLMSVVWIHR